MDSPRGQVAPPPRGAAWIVRGPGRVAAAGCRVDSPRGRIAPPPRGAAWIVRGSGSRRRRGCDENVPWRRVAATPRPDIQRRRDRRTGRRAAHGRLDALAELLDVAAVRAFDLAGRVEDDTALDVGRQRRRLEARPAAPAAADDADCRGAVCLGVREERLDLWGAFKRDAATPRPRRGRCFAATPLPQRGWSRRLRRGRTRLGLRRLPGHRLDPRQEVRAARLQIKRRRET